jgi:uncharacterized protein YdhG (YjbR/CyaY superfamily)
MITTKPNNIDEYIAGFPKDVQKILEQVREAVKKAAPGAEETIKYAMPAFTLNGNLVFFAAFKNHIGFYSAPTDDQSFKKDLAGYVTGKGSVQFPLDKPMPISLITKMVKFRVVRNSEKTGKKKSK